MPGEKIRNPVGTASGILVRWHILVTTSLTCLINPRVIQEDPSYLPILEEGVFSKIRIHPLMALFPRFLIGIVSFGETYCGGLNNPRPGVYTNITSHVQWVSGALRICYPPDP